MFKENQIPNKIDPFRLADQRVQLKGTYSLKDMVRLKEYLSNAEGEILVDCLFGTDEQKIRWMRCVYDANLILQCQRCMEAFLYRVNPSLLAGFVRSEEAESALPGKYEAIVVSEDLFSLRDWLEEELILSLPIVPMHPIKGCEVILPKNLGSVAESEEIEQSNPFKIIELLRSKQHNSK